LGAAKRTLDGDSVMPSGDDRAEFEWLAGYTQADGLIALMLIAAQNGQAWFLGLIFTMLLWLVK
jgi:hypothetical protein